MDRLMAAEEYFRISTDNIYVCGSYLGLHLATGGKKRGREKERKVHVGAHGIITCFPCFGATRDPKRFNPIDTADQPVL